MLKHSLHICSITILFFLLSCSSEKPAEFRSQKPSETGSSGVSETSSETSSEHEPSIRSPYTLEITPLEPMRNSIIHLIPHGFNLSDAKIVWLVNGNLTTSPEPNQFKAKETNRGDKIQAKAMIKGSEVLSNIIKIKNTPPEFKRIKIMPEVFKPGDTLYIDASGSDIDGDEVTILYEWTKNGEPAGNSKKLEVPIKRGDKVAVKMTPFDGEVYGRPVILHREIRNMPPMIIENKEFNFDGKVYTYQIKATDPDEDTLTYSLKSSPLGMEIDSSTGLITWDVPPGTRGKQSITVFVTDGSGGEAVQSLTFEVTSIKR